MFGKIYGGRRNDNLEPRTVSSASRSHAAAGAPSGWMGMQRSVGNQAIQRMMNPRFVIQRAPLMQAEDKEEETRQTGSSSVRQLASFASLSGPDNDADAAMAAPMTNGKGNKLPDIVQAKMEYALKSDFSDVEIHQSPEAERIGAMAFTQGNQIHFAPGHYEPYSEQGQELIGHELAHVIQQRRGRVPATTLVNGSPVNDDVHLEREADELGRKAARHRM